MKPQALLALLLFSITGCVSPKPNLVVIGNSITWHIADPSIDWHGNWGMAVNSESKDFAHVSAAALGLPVKTRNLVSVERLSRFYPRDVEDVAGIVNGESTVVVELGDNAYLQNKAAFGSAYRSLLESVGRRRRLICLSTFWQFAPTDAVIKASCEYYGGTYVFIGDIYHNPDNPDYATVLYSDPAVQGHPHDWSMQQIGERVAAAAEPKRAQPTP